MRGLDGGADDYITKPFSPSELIARMRAVLRRAQPSAASRHTDLCRAGDGPRAHRVTRDGRPRHLGPTEFRLLRFLMEHPGRVYSREQLLDAVWGHDIYVELRTVDVHIRRLRKAINGAERGRPDPHRALGRLRAGRDEPRLFKVQGRPFVGADPGRLAEKPHAPTACAACCSRRGTCAARRTGGGTPSRTARTPQPRRRPGS